MSTSTKRRQTRSQRADKRGLREFAGVDGEGGDIAGKHEYLLLRAGEFAVETGKPLTPYECFGFLADLPKDKIWVSFAFDYDVTMMIRHLHPSRVEALFNRDDRVIRNKDGENTGRFFPVKVGHGEFEIDYMPHKEFRVRRTGGKWTVVSDVFTFFQSSFVRALQKWYVDEPDMHPLIERIAEGKAMRNEFGEVTEYEREYNLLEVRILAKLMERFRAMCIELDIKPRKWQGPGNLVSAVFKREGLPTKHDNDVPFEVMQCANAAYYGGRFEVKDYGHIPGPIYQADLNSAYASYYKHLPCLIHGGWEYINELPQDSESIWFADVSFVHPEGYAWYTLPVRSESGTLLFPRQARGWYWCHELRIAQKYGATLHIHGGWRYIRNCECRHFDWVYALYDERDRVGKTSGKGKVLKIVLATIYGKLAQSKGNPVFANPIWSGLVVSYCRARLADATLSMDKGHDVHMLATDGLFSTNPRTLDIGEALGQWTVTKHDDLFIVQSGIYFVPGEKPKTRGVPQSKVIEYEDEFRRVWKQWVDTNDVTAAVPVVKVLLRVFMAARLARARGKPWSAGRWKNNIPKKVAFDWSTKRQNPVLDGLTLHTEPAEGSIWLVSQAPKWSIGGNWDPDTLLDVDQPDWADKLQWDDDVF